MIRSAHELVQQAVLEVINHMMLKDDPWDPMAVRSVVILLWKQKGSKADLNQYRGISLLSVLSRILARVLAIRLGIHAEANWIAHSCSVGFQKRAVYHRSFFHFLGPHGNSGHSLSHGSQWFHLLSPHGHCESVSQCGKSSNVQASRRGCAGLSNSSMSLLSMSSEPRQETPHLIVSSVV